MMQRYENTVIQELPLSVPLFRHQVVSFLEENGLRMEELEAYFAVTDSSGSILSGAGLYRDIIKCIAVRSDARSEGLLAPLISHIISEAASRGRTQLRLFTKPENAAIFESLGFHTVARAPLAILMERGRGLEQYCDYLRRFHPERKGIGVVVMNANPFTLGHRYLLEQAAAQVEQLFLIPVKEDVSAFPYAERQEMMRSAAPEGVTVLEGSDYQISALTFPTYFLKDLSDAAETQMRLDIDLFARHIAPALGADVRFVGSEEDDPLTARYNALLQELLPIPVVEIPRLRHAEQGEESPVSASRVRQSLERGRYSLAAALCPASSRPYLLAHLADRALRLELDTPLKPGLVGPDGPGAHRDMDYALMLKGIAALRPFWSRMARASVPPLLQMIGIEAEKAMKKATGGVNTHRGAIFALGLALNACGTEVTVPEELMRKSLAEIAGRIVASSLNDSELCSTHGSAAVQAYGVKGAREMALHAYEELWSDWLPFYRSFGEKPGDEARQRTLLRIMSTLDDTCIIHRVGYERAQRVKQEAEKLDLNEMCIRYAAEGISPGGAADMLALTIFIDSIIL